MQKRVETKAYHETGHVVAAYVEGVAVNFVTTLALDDVTAAVAQTHSATYLARELIKQANWPRS
jgi:hypothetical protein